MRLRCRRDSIGSYSSAPSRKNFHLTALEKSYSCFIPLIHRKRRLLVLSPSARLNLVLQCLIAIDLPANVAYIVGMAEKHTQYTIRKVPPHLDEELRRRAHQEHKSLNELALWALARGLGLSEQEVRHHDLDDLAGTWVDDPAFDQAIEAMDQVDPELWS